MVNLENLSGLAPGNGIVSGGALVKPRGVETEVGVRFSNIRETELEP